MVTINLKYPLDSTFLSLLIYEGLLFLAKDYATFISRDRIVFEEDFLIKSIKKLDDTKINKLKKVYTVGKNDNPFIISLISLFKKDQGTQKKENSFGWLLEQIKSSIKNISDTASLNFNQNIDIGVKFKSKDILLGLDSKNNKITAPQILKIERYTGFTSTESKFTTKQLTLRISKEITLISLLGLYSSYVTGFKVDKNYHYFLFFSPEEIQSLLFEGNKDLLKNYVKIKEVVSQLLEQSLKEVPDVGSVSSILELLLNLKLRRELELETDKISFILFKIAREGNTYKIYEKIPINIYKETKFYVLLIKYFRNPEKLLNILSNILYSEEYGDSYLLNIIKNSNYKEYNNILLAIQSLYKFVIFGDMQGYYEFISNLAAAAKKLENSKNVNELSRSKMYKKMIIDLRYC